MRLGIVRLYTGESGGIGYYNIQELGLARELVSTLNIEVMIFILRDKMKYPQKDIIDIEKNIKIIYLPVTSLGNHGLLNPNQLSEFKLDIIQLNSDNQIGCSRVIKWALKKEIPIYTYIGTISSDSDNRIKKIISKVIFEINFKMMKKITNVAKTPIVLENLKSLGINNVTIIPVGLDLENFRNLKLLNSNEYLANKYGIPYRKKILLFVGRLEEYKKPLITLELIDYIRKKEKGYHLLVVGDGSLKNDFLNNIKSLNLQNYVTHIERIENKYMQELYQLSDVFINTNDKEIYGMSILEAMYCGCPVIAQKAPGPSYIIEDGDTGYIIDGYDTTEWYDKIKKVMINREKFSKKSIERINEKFTWKMICSRYDELFKRLKG